MARGLLGGAVGIIRSCERLRHEHQVIGQLAEELEMLVQLGRRGCTVPPPPISGAIEFFSAFVDRCHDTKEEEGLFPLLEAYGMPGGQTMAAQHAEHEEGRRLLAALRPLSGRKPVDAEALTLLETYVGLVHRHIRTEDAEVIPVAERVLTVDDDLTLGHAFDRIEERALGKGGREVLLGLGDAVIRACRAMMPELATVSAETLARHLMRPKPRSLAPEESLARAAELMESLGTREVPVVAGGALVGILTRTDMEPHRGHFEWTAVRAAMTPDPLTVAPEATVRGVASILLERGFNSLPVVNGDQLVGMIARSDVIRVLAQER